MAATAAPSSNGSDRTIVSVAVPPGFEPGDVLTVHVDGPGTPTVEVAVPPGAEPGDVIEALVLRDDEKSSERPPDEGIRTTVVETVEERPDGTAVRTIATTTEFPDGRAETRIETVTETTFETVVVDEGGGEADDGGPSSGDGPLSGGASRGVVVTVPSGAGPGDVLTVDVDGHSFEFVVPEGGKPGDEFRVSVEQEEEEDETGEEEEEAPIPAPDRQRKEEEEEEEDLRGGQHAEAEAGEQLVEIDITADGDTIDLEVPSDATPGADVVVTFEAPDGRRFSVPIPEDASPGDVLTIRLPPCMVARTERIDLREVRQRLRRQMLAAKKERDAEAESRRPGEGGHRKQKSERTQEGRVGDHLSGGVDADAFYAAGEIRSGGRYVYNAGALAASARNDGSATDGPAGEANPYMPDVAPTQSVSEWYRPAPEPKEAVIDVEESRKNTVERSSVVRQFEEDRAAVFDEDGTEKPAPMLVIALEAAAIVRTRRGTEGGNARLDVLVAADAMRRTANVVAGHS